MKTAVAVLAAFALALPLSATAQSKGSSSASSDASGQMHSDMMKGAKESMSMKPFGDVDQDFVKMMRRLVRQRPQLFRTDKAMAPVTRSNH